MHKLKPIHPKQNQKQIMHQCMKAINYECFKLEGKITINVKKNKNNFIYIIGGNRGKLEIDNFIL